jgi:hypothetical protein
MQTRIVFNGHEYSGIEAMPDDVRRAFQDKLAQLTKDADHDGVPDVLQGKGIGIEGAAITINGRTIENIGSLPKPLRWLVNSMLEHAVGEAATLQRSNAPTPEQARMLRSLDATSTALRTLLLTLSAGAAGALVALGIWIMVHMDAGSRSQGGNFYVGILVLLAFAWLVGSIVSLMRGARR